MPPPRLNPGIDVASVGRAPKIGDAAFSILLDAFADVIGIAQQVLSRSFTRPGRLDQKGERDRVALFDAKAVEIHLAEPRLGPGVPFLGRDRVEKAAEAGLRSMPRPWS